MHDIDERRRRAARSQCLFRGVNEQIAALSQQLADFRLASGYICECLNLDCSSTVALSDEEYERLRETSTRFFVLHGHEDPAVENVVEETTQYLVVEKVGVARELAEAMYTRRVTAAA